ncbi:MAG: hypothetical protein KDC38_20845, partial [Planctomycetes bacterium]|nr:hypothetical protein [Planctomycetota bacterium]
MTDERFDSGDVQPVERRSTLRRVLANLGWVLGGAVLAIVLISDPLGIHPIDTWIHDSLGHGDAAEAGIPGAEVSESGLWTCGMHPEVILDEPGQCPICGMNLVPLSSEVGPSEAAAETVAVEAGESGWTCELHPQIVENEPGECPIDGRPLVPIETSGGPMASGATGGEREILYYRHPHDPGIVSDVPAK